MDKKQEPSLSLGEENLAIKESDSLEHVSEILRKAPLRSAKKHPKINRKTG